MTEYIELFNLEGRTAIITGGAGLLGTEFCTTLAQAGASIVVADINSQAALDLSEKLQERGFQAIPHETDITSEISVRKLVDVALNHFNQVDILVNCAAIDPKFDRKSPGSFSEEFSNYPLELWHQALEVNLTGAMLCCREVSKPMLEVGKGSIINVSSIYGAVSYTHLTLPTN